MISTEPPHSPQNTFLRIRSRACLGIVPHSTAARAVNCSFAMSGKILEQEAERKKFSRERRDEIAQTLLGINVRRLTLKRAATGGWAIPKKEVANTRRLVRESVQSINQFASELGSRRQT